MKSLALKDSAVIVVLFISAFWLWTLPIQDNPLPFGEHDGAYIFSHGDHMTHMGKTSDLVGTYPLSILFWYSGWNEALGPTAIDYPPPYLLGYTYSQVFGGERIVPPYLFIAITSFAGLLSLYLLIRHLYGFEAALIAAVGALFNARIIQLYIWGQRHNIAAFIFVPLAMYAMYAYLKSYYEKDEKIVYAYLFAMAVLATYLVHLSATVFLVPFSFFLILFFILKYRKLPFSVGKWKHYLAIGIVFLLVVSNFYLLYFGPKSVDANPGIYQPETFFQWIFVPDNGFNMNPSFSSLTDNYPGVWTFGLVFLGIIFLLLRRKPEDFVILSALISLYLMFHLPNFGLIEFDNYRVGRFLALESYFFYALMGIGILFLLSLVPLEKSAKKYATLGLSFGFVIFIILTQGVSAYESLSNTYPNGVRITPQQYEFTQWVEANIPETSALHLLGPISYAKKGYIQVLSRRTMVRNDDFPLGPRLVNQSSTIQDPSDVPDVFVSGPDLVIPLDYLVLDYSDFILFRQEQGIAFLQQVESQIVNISSLVYDKNNIKVYKYD